MQPLPAACPPGLVPDATDVDAFNAAYRRAQVPGVRRRRGAGPAVDGEGDTLTAGPDHTVVDGT
ncbi:hypothetical protein OHA27_33055 [Streptomyces sp. NBC_01619]|uniref:Uncharacterized protein n=1 Tax=Streptomyces pratisoli TaxID=3139917 RepID=A0ACC6QPW6_9ACTN|nr:hypothetical protein [Streptomyces sp. NBC_01619]MCX4515079.1 hypothetical protein [Streptomyces sp. NBC_01619]